MHIILPGGLQGIAVAPGGGWFVVAATGGGRAGNVARGAVQVLRTSIPYVSEVVTDPWTLRLSTGS